MPSFEIQTDIFSGLSVKAKGSSNTFKTHKNIRLYLIYEYSSFPKKRSYLWNALLTSISSDFSYRI